MFRIACIAIGYIIGCFQTAYIVGKIFNNIDIRKHGSGNAGTTNVARTLGFKSGLITFLGDFLKAFLAVIIFTSIYSPIGGLYAGIGVVLGHNYPIFLKFKGGKGIASTVGIITCYDYRIAFILLIIFIIVAFSTRYISLASIIIAISIPILFILIYKDIEVILIGLFFAISAIIRHKSNIKRLINKNESKFKIKGR